MTTSDRTHIDPITAQVIQSGLVAAAEEMRIALVKTAYNPIIYEVQDFCVALLSHKGEMLAQGSSLPLFLPCLSVTIQNGVKKFGPDGFSPGDLLIANDPYSTGTHISDTSIYTPIFFDGELQAFSANTAHWADVGGKSPGGWCPDSSDLFQEGMIFPHLKLYDAGQMNETMMDYIMANTRFPDLVRGDLGAQIAACRTGVNRYVALCQKYGATTVRGAMELVFDQSEALMRRLIRDIPDGEWSAETCMDHDGIVTDEPRKLKVTVRIDGDDVTIDFTGTDETATGPINIPLAGARAAAEIAIKSATVPHEPANEGHSRPLAVVSPEHTITNPSWPAPCDSYGYAALILTDLVSEALSHALPERCPSGEYMLLGTRLFRIDPRRGKPFIVLSPQPGGGGALPFDDGADGLIFHGDGDAPNTPAEIAETRWPLRVERYELHRQEYGIGEFRGGLGTIRDYHILTDNVLLQMNSERTVCRPRGLFGGSEGGINRVRVNPGTEDEVIYEQRVSRVGPFDRGTIVSARTAGGAGWGDPLQRDPERVRLEVLNEILSPEEAEGAYGVVIERDGAELTVNQAVTERIRRERRERQSPPGEAVDG
jgi:N-methylhydantoinase B